MHVLLFKVCFPTRSEERYVHDSDHIMIMSMFMIMFVMLPMETIQSLVILKYVVSFSHVEKALLII